MPARFSWDDLKPFLAMARAGRLTVAARQMGIDHSTLSRRIAALEAALGLRLFDRGPGGFVLTPEGEGLVADAEAMETLALRLGEAGRGMGTGMGGGGGSAIAGTVRLGTPEAFGTYFLAPRLGALTRAHPALGIELVAVPRLFSLSKREVDLAIAMSRPPQRRLSAERLVDYELGVYAAPAYLAAMGPVCTRAALQEQRWVGYVEDLMWTPELDYLPDIAPAIVPHLRVSNIISQLEAVAGGAALGVLPCFMARARPDLLRLFPAEIRLFRSYWLVTHTDTKDLARIRLTADFLTREARAAAGFWA